MSGKFRKRKQRDTRDAYPHSNPQPSPSWESETTSEPSAALFIQAYEADIVRGPRAWAAASSLEASGRAANIDAHNSGLMQWKTAVCSEEEEEEGKIIWVDRYDARLLLDALPETSRAPEESGRLSPDGWSDLPSDAEDTFFFSREEAEDYHRDKRRRTINQGREQRMKALRLAASEEECTREEDEWGGSDEEPDDSQKELMRRTASHILTSPNSAQLEMRILANHGADRRFAFLRGRWSRAWRLAKTHARMEMQKERQEKEQANSAPALLGGLAGYGDSDEESTLEEHDGPDNLTTDVAVAPTDRTEYNTAGPDDVEVPAPAPGTDDAAKEARRARAREWAAKRRALKGGSEATG